MSAYLILWITLAPVAGVDGGLVSSQATGGGAVAMSIMGAPITHIPFAGMKSCELALKRITARSTAAGVCVANRAD